MSLTNKTALQVFQYIGPDYFRPFLNRQHQETFRSQDVDSRGREEGCDELQDLRRLQINSPLKHSRNRHLIWIAIPSFVERRHNFRSVEPSRWMLGVIRQSCYVFKSDG